MVRFSELEYKRPDFAYIKKKLRHHIDTIARASSYSEAKAAFLRFNTVFENAATMIVTARIRHDVNTADPFYEAETKWLEKQLVLLAPLLKKLNKAMTASRYAANFAADYGELLLRDMEAQLRTQNNRILLLMIRENELVRAYSKLAAGCRTDFRGESCNFYGLLRHMQSPDRSERREAFEAWAALYEGIAPQLDKLYSRLVALRVKKARRLGFSGYTELAYLSRGRYDYGPDEVRRFREAVRDCVVPACQKLYEKQRARLGVDRLHYYDESLNFPGGNPVPEGSPEQMVEAAGRMYRELSPETGEFFNFMTRYELFDLVTGPGKRLGGYCTGLPGYKAPFIFSNFNGTSADVDVLTHEAGHAFEYYTASRELPLHQQHYSTSEINEIHSMSMEFFTHPYMDKFFGDRADQYRACHLADALCTIPYLVSVDEFQHRVFEKPRMTAEERYAVWKQIEQTYLPWRDYDGNAFLEKGGFWMQKQHIFMYPFYYVDYALAQLCAFQYYLRIREDRDKAWNDYLRLCRAGGSRGYFELLEVGELARPFDAEVIRSTVGQIMALLENDPNLEPDETAIAAARAAVAAADAQAETGAGVVDSDGGQPEGDAADADAPEDEGAGSPSAQTAADAPEAAETPEASEAPEAPEGAGS